MSAESVSLLPPPAPAAASRWKIAAISAGVLAALGAVAALGAAHARFADASSTTSAARLGSAQAPWTPVGLGQMHDKFTSFAPQCEEDLRHNACGPVGELCGCQSLRPGVGPATGRALTSMLEKANIFMIGDSTSKMMVHHSCRTLVDPLQDPHGAACFREDGMPTVFAQPSNLRPLSPTPSLLAHDMPCCTGDRGKGSCCMTMLESMVGAMCSREGSVNAGLGGIGFVHMASSFKENDDMPCEYRHGRQLPLTFKERAATALQQFAGAVATNARTTVVVIDVNVWMGLEMDGMKHYNNIIAWTKEAVMLSGLPIERTVLMMKTLYECGDEGSWHCERNNELIRRAGEANGVPVFDFAAIFKNKGLDPKTALRTDGIHQMPDTALYEMYNMLEFVQQRFIGGNVLAGGK